MPVGVGQVADLVDDEKCWSGLMGQAPVKRGGTIDRGQFAQKLARASEQGGVAMRTAWWAMLRASVDLPAPLGPIKTALAARITSRRIRSTLTKEIDARKSAVHCWGKL